jgi:hypothetical protein
MKGRAMVQWAAPAALAVLVMLPRLASPQFGLLDDGLTLETGRETIGRWSSVLALIPETGRFFPAYWLVYSGVFAVVGVRPLAFFAVNVAVLAGLLAILGRLVRLSGGTSWEALVTVVIFAACGPAVEAFYTLSKAEPLQMIWIGVALLATAASAGEARRGRRVAFVVAAASALLLAYTTKETSAALIPISLGWVAIEWPSGMRRPAARFATTFAAINVVAAAAFVALRWRYAARPLAEGWYTRAYSFAPETLGPAIFRIVAWLVRDFAFLLPLLALAVVLLRQRDARWRRPILYACVWMVGWLGVYAPWPATFEYYLLPFSFGAAVFAGAVVGGLGSARACAVSIVTRRVAWSALAASALLWVAALVNAAADARVQLAVDRANTDVVDFLAGLPRGGRIVLNTTDAIEYFHELPMHLSEIKQRPDLIVQPAGIAAPGVPSAADVVVATPTVINRPGPTVRVAVYEAGARHDLSRLGEMLRGGGELIYTTEQRVRVVEVGLQRLLCRIARRPLIDPSYCQSDRRVIHAATFVYAWQVHRLSPARVERVAETPT